MRDIDDMYSHCVKTACLIAGLLFAAAVAGAETAAADRRPVILAVGESTTAGWGVAPESSYPAQLQALLTQAGYQYRVVNHGRSGSTSAMALAGLDRGLRLGPEIVLIALGGNDRGNRVAAQRTRENLSRMVSLYVRAGARVFLADRSARSDGGDANGLFAELAEEEGAVLMPSLRARVAGHPELLLADGSHPNAEGYAIVAGQVFEVIAPWLEKPRSGGSRPEE